MKSVSKKKESQALAAQQIMAGCKALGWTVTLIKSTENETLGAVVGAPEFVEAFNKLNLEFEIEGDA